MAKQRRSIYQVTLASACVAASLAGCSDSSVQPQADPPERYGDVITLDQGWGGHSRDVFYHEPQGSPIMPYDWFLVLEQPGSESRFRDDAYLLSFGLIQWGDATERNPDRLPVGLTRDWGIYGDEPKLGMNCGACHVDQISYRGKSILIDGGASHFNLWAFLAALEAALKETHDDDAKFARFATAILHGAGTEQDRIGLRARLRSVLALREEWSYRNKAGVTPGPGRVDALNVILNQVSAQMLGRADNARPADAPVSIPFVWDAPYLDIVQYNASVPNAGAGAVGRNVGQVLGVFGEVSVIPATMPPGYPNSVRTESLMKLERRMQTLKSPRWQELADKGVLPPLDPKKVEDGETVYKQECAGCHRVIDPQNRGALASIPVTKRPVNSIGTDPVATLSFAQRVARTGPIQGRKEDYVRGRPLDECVNADRVLEHVAIGVMVNDLGGFARGVLDRFWSTIRKFFSGKQSAAVEQANLGAQEVASGGESVLLNAIAVDGLDRNDDADEPGCPTSPKDAVYRARPLDGIWATGPYLHNGSVPTLADLLLPPEQRPARFLAGSRELDPVRVGFTQGAGGFEFDTSQRGNSNLGHDKGTRLDDPQKEALLEYLKSL